MSIETETPPLPATAFESVYRDNVRAITNYFARRCGDPQEVADLTQETFVQAIGSLRSYDPRRGGTRGWLFGIARRVFAQHCERAAGAREASLRLGGRRELDRDEVEELTARIDAERPGRILLARCAALPPLEREAIELIDLAGLTPREAASALGIAPGVIRVRLFRARAKLRTARTEE